MFDMCKETKMQRQKKVKLGAFDPITKAKYE